MNARADDGCAACRLGKGAETLTREGFPLSAAARPLRHIRLFFFSGGVGVPTGQRVGERERARAGCNHISCTSTGSSAGRVRGRAVVSLATREGRLQIDVLYFKLMFTMYTYLSSFILSSCYCQHSKLMCSFPNCWQSGSDYTSLSCLLFLIGP